MSASEEISAGAAAASGEDAVVRGRAGTTAPFWSDMLAALTGGSGRAPTPTLPRDWTSTWLVLLVSAVMGFLASLGVAVASGADALARSWTDDLASRATLVLEIAPDDGGALADALVAVRSVDGVASASPLDDGAIATHLGPWLGEDAEMIELQLPRLVDITLVPGASLPIEAITAALNDAGVAGEVDAHGEWIARLAPAAHALRALAQGALILIGLAAALTVALACAAGLAAQARVVDVLKLVGAEDRYISRIFVRRSQLLTFGGSAIGAALAVVALLWTSGATPAPGPDDLAPLTPRMTPSGADWVWFTAIPLAFALIATLAAHIFVMIALRRREG